MKQLSILFAPLFVIFLFACENNEEVKTNEEEGFGTVMVSGGLIDCNTWIEMDNGTLLIPLNWTDFKLVSNERVNIKYETVDKQTSCDGEDCILLKYETLSCKPYVDLYFFNMDSLERDPVTMNEVSFEQNCLVVNLSYSGGCSKHLIDLARVHPSCGTPPLPPPTFEIRHDAKGDACEAWITKTIEFDLSPLNDELDTDTEIVLNANTGGDTYYNEKLTFKIN